MAFERASTTIKDLPVEVLCNIFSFLSFREQVPRLLLVCKAWKGAVEDCRWMTLEATSRVAERGLDNILACYPRLEYLYLEPSLGKDPDSGTRLLQKVASQFTGHPTIKYVFCPCDRIVPGALDNCPRLEGLIVPTFQGVDIEAELEVAELELLESQDTPTPDDEQARDLEIWRGSGMRRNLAWILSRNPKLKAVTLYCPTVWLRNSQCVPASFTELTNLKLYDVSSYALESFLDFMRTPEGAPPRFPWLKDLTLDIDWLVVDADAYKAISRGCPNLESLKFLYAIFHPTGLTDIAETLPGLKELVLERCDIWFQGGWVAAARYLCSKLNLTKLWFESSVYRQLPDTIKVEHAGTRQTFKLRSLKIYDTDEHRPNLAEVKETVLSFPHLTELMMDVPADAFKEGGAELWVHAANELVELEKVVLKCGRGSAPWTSNSLIPFKWPKLRSLEIWSPPGCPLNLLLPNAETLRTLKLYYLPEVLEENVEIALPNLRKLEVYGISHLGQDIALAAVRSLTSDCPLLKSVYVEAHCRDPQPVSTNFLRDLARRCPQLESIHFDKFIFPTDSLSFMANPNIWPHLTTLHLSGRDALVGPTIQWEQHQLWPFLEAHRLLTSLHLGLGSGFRGGWRHAVKLVTPVLPNEDACVAYARRIKRLTPWVHDVIISGPRDE
ncbi:hypothetical protein BC832DRAFT_595594 [Gaertneriomyces semiglobifer]|nr:hypothetical protein BC832DRAFT_595594 [Gaertneriomyces semiglobifer]